MESNPFFEFPAGEVVGVKEAGRDEVVANCAGVDHADCWDTVEEDSNGESTGTCEDGEYYG